MCVSDRMDIDPERERCFHAFMYMGVCVCVYVCMRVCERERDGLFSCSDQTLPSSTLTIIQESSQCFHYDNQNC